MGRWKLGPQGAYYDPNDTGPDQVATPGGAPQLAAIAGVLGGRPGEGPGRWKVGRNGQPEWEAGVTAPNQIAPPPMLEHTPGWPVPGQDGWSPGQFPTDAAGVPQIPGEVSHLGAPPPGFDATKWANPEHQTAKYRAGRALAAGQSLEDVAKMLGGEGLGNDRLRWTNPETARQEYGNVYNRRRGEWGTAYDKAMGEYGLGRDIFQANQDRPFNKLSSIAGLGQVAGSQLGALGAQYSNLYGQTAQGGAGAQGDYWTQAANARAAGQVGGENAWNPVYNLPWMWGL